MAASQFLDDGALAHPGGSGQDREAFRLADTGSGLDRHWFLGSRFPLRTGWTVVRGRGSVPRWVFLYQLNGDRLVGARGADEPVREGAARVSGAPEHT
ncbi:hypothetical protein GCM10022630_17380 [Thermobifida alba]